MFETTEEAEESLRNYLSKFGKDIVYREGIIYLYGRTYDRRWHIFNFLDRRESYKGFFLFHPEFVAGLNRIVAQKVQEGNTDSLRCAIAKQISEDIKQKECRAEDTRCKIATEIADTVVEKECSVKKRRIGFGKWEEIKEERITDYLNYDLSPDDIQNKRNPFPNKMYRWASKAEWENIKEGDRAGGHWSTNLGDFSYMSEYKVLLVTKNREGKDWVGEAMHAYSNIKKPDILEVYAYNSEISLWERVVEKECSAIEVNWDTTKTDIPIFDMSIIYANDPKKHYNCELKWLTPDEFLDWQCKTKGATKEMFLRGVMESTVNDIIKGIKKGNVFNAFVLEFDELGKLERFQEGRHRIIAMKRLGIERVPVYFCTRIY